MIDPTLSQIAGQAVGFVALALCLLAFADRRDERLLVILIFGNVAFALQYALFAAWTAAAVSALVIVRIVLARRWPGNAMIMTAMLGATLGVAVLTWSGPRDLFPLAAGLIGTFAMFMLRGVPMRLGLAGAALCWIVTNALIGSVGALAAELLIFVTNAVTIARLRRTPSPRV